MRHRVEALDHDIVLGFIDPHGHLISSVMKFLGEDFRVPVKPADAGPVGGVDGQVQGRSRRGQTFLDGCQQRLDALPGFGGDQKTRPLGRATGGDVSQVFAHLRREAIDLVPDFENALSSVRVDAELAQHGVDIVLLRIGVFMGYVADVENDVGLQHLLKRGAKRGNQLRRQVGNEPDGIGQHRLPSKRKAQRAQGRIQRRE